MKNRLIIFGAIGSLIVLGAAFLGIRGQYDAPSKAEVIEPKTGPVAAKPSAEALQTLSDRTIKQAQEIHPARQAYFSGQAAREVIEKGRSNPAHGGMRYARTVYISCINFTPDKKPLSNLPNYSASEDSALTLKRRQAYEALTTRCGGLLPQDLAISENPVFAGLIDKDEFIHLDRKILSVKPGWSLERQQALDQLFNYKDPAMMMDFGARLARSNGDYWLDGKKLSTTEQEEMLAAWRIVPCKFGADCGPDSYIMLAACAFDAQCFANREGWILALAKEQDASVSTEKVKSFVEQLTVAIEKGDSSVFKPKT